MDAMDVKESKFRDHAWGPQAVSHVWIAVG